MVSEAPPFWWQKAGWQAWLLSPFSLLYGKVAGRRMRTGKRASVTVPVICIGNFTVGGAGKTPTAMAIARAAVAKGFSAAVMAAHWMSPPLSIPHIIALPMSETSRCFWRAKR